MKNDNKKSKGQLSKKPQQPQPKNMREAVVKIRPDAEVKVDIQTGNVSDLEMYKFLQDMAKHFARVLCEDAKEVVGDSPEEQIKYLNFRIEQSGLNG